MTRLRDEVGKFFAGVARIFMPPFAGLPLIMWAFFIIAYVALPHYPAWHGDLPDPDDYTYLSQTLAWLHGQNWFDNVQHRMNPPFGVPIHYSRIAEMPIAACIMLFRVFHYSWRGAALFASFLLPVIYLGFLFAALRWTAAKLASPDWARLSAFIVMFAAAYLFKFAPGQVDHHGLEGILTIVAVGAVVRMFERPERIRWGALAGFVLALALAIALETLPWLAIIATAIGLWTVAERRKTARGATIFSVSLFVTSVACLALDRPVADILTQDILVYSVTYVYLTGGIALALLCAAAVSGMKNARLRWLIAGVVAVGLGVAFFMRFPALLVGPYGAMDKTLAKLFFANLQEAIPLLDRFTPFQQVLRLGTSLIGLAACVVFLRRTTGDKKWAWGLVAALLAAAMGLAVFYQVRVLLYATLFAVLPLTFFAERGWAWIGAHYEGRKRFWAEICLVLLLGPLTGVLFPALQDGRSFNTGVFLFPAETFDDSCYFPGLDRFLDQPEYAARAPLRIMNMMDSGPEILFRTPHAVMAAPYHTNVRGNLDSLAFFSATDMAKAHQIAKTDDIDFVVMCRDIPDMYLAGKGPHYVVYPNGEVAMKPNASLAGQMAFHHAPAWLEEISVPPMLGYQLFSVVK
ncbi:MAG: hypothetical protein KGI97_00555 [Alphaproteobacteria bacterium]|nr:hypothetical protein [Alphaproteobacteria bacterium]